MLQVRVRKEQMDEMEKERRIQQQILSAERKRVGVVTPPRSPNTVRSPSSRPITPVIRPITPSSRNSTPRLSARPNISRGSDRSAKSSPPVTYRSRYSEAGTHIEEEDEVKEEGNEEDEESDEPENDDSEVDEHDDEEAEDEDSEEEEEEPISRASSPAKSHRSMRSEADKEEEEASKNNFLFIVIFV